MLDAVARHPRAATVSVVLTTGTVSVVLTTGTVSVVLAAGMVSVVLAAGGVPTRRSPCPWAGQTIRYAASLRRAAALHPGGPGRAGRPPGAAPNPRERYLFLARTVLVGRENGSYNVDRARTWLRGSGCLPVAWGLAPHRLALCRYVGCLLVVWVGAGVRPSGSASLSGCPPVVRGPGAAAARREAVAVAGGVFVEGLGGGVAHSSWGPGGAVGVIPTFFRPGRRR